MSRHDERVDAVFAALADPTRRAVLGRLAATPAVTATELAGPLPVTRQAVVKHLQALSEAGLVTGRRHGREVRYEITPAPLGDAVGWIVSVGAEWDRRLARLRRQLGGRSA
ncbi:MAG: ArsR/SmtB family transcription factor [Acidimicrobiia bacterium]|jgi:DNA-binding transcriptional ArsR family regulator